MSKLFFVNKVFGDDVFTNLDLKILKTLYVKSFMSIKEISNAIDVEEYEVLSALTKMKNSAIGVVMVSDKLYFLSEKGDEVIEVAAKEWYESENPDVDLTGNRTKRSITSDMNKHRDFVLDYFGDLVKEPIIDRQNYIINFKNTKVGFRKIEIRHDGKIRIVVAKVKQKAVDHFMKIDGSVWQKLSPSSYSYRFDFDVSRLNEICENITTVLGDAK